LAISAGRTFRGYSVIGQPAWSACMVSLHGLCMASQLAWSARPPHLALSSLCVSLLSPLFFLSFSLSLSFSVQETHFFLNNAVDLPFVCPHRKPFFRSLLLCVTAQGDEKRESEREREREERERESRERAPQARTRVRMMRIAFRILAVRGLAGIATCAELISGTTCSIRKVHTFI
jgi:hypothetical protein